MAYMKGMQQSLRLHQWIGGIALSATLTLAGCGGGEEAESESAESGLSDDQQRLVDEFDAKRKAEELKHAVNPNNEEFVGVWVIGDIPEQQFDLVVLPDGTAQTNWLDGENGVRGEFGRWSRQDDGVLLEYDSGWRDIIRKDKDGNYRKYSYAPGAPLDGAHNNESSAESFFGPKLPFIGVWQGNDYDGNPLFYMSLRSDSSGRKSNNLNAFADWVVIENVARIVWTDGSYNELVPANRKEAILRVWRRDSSRDGEPDASFKISMVQEPASGRSSRNQVPDGEAKEL